MGLSVVGLCFGFMVLHCDSERISPKVAKQSNSVSAGDVYNVNMMVS